MDHSRTVSLPAPVTRRSPIVGCAVLFSLFAAVACSAPPGALGEDDPPGFTGTQSSGGTSAVPGGGGSSQTGTTPPPTGVGGTGSTQPTGEGNPDLPGVGTGGTGGSGGTGSGQLPAGTGGSASVPTGTGGTATAGGAGGAGGTGTTTDPDPVVTLPEPPGEAFFFDDFEAGTAGTQPAAWDRWINYTLEAGNTLTGDQYALLDSSESFRGNQSVHFHATGASQPAMLTLPLPEGTSRVYIRAFVKTSVQVGNQVPNQQSNHETLIGLRAKSNDGNFEIRFGGAKGALGFNMVGPGRSDALSPGEPLWGTAPAIAPGDWHCVELAFINDNPQSPQARASLDGTEIRAVTVLGDWHVPLSNEGVTWLNGMFKEVIFGWQSFSPAPANDVWMDDIVLSESPIGCN